MQSILCKTTPSLCQLPMHNVKIDTTKSKSFMVEASVSFSTLQNKICSGIAISVWGLINISQL